MPAQDTDGDNELDPIDFYTCNWDLKLESLETRKHVFFCENI